MCDTKKEAGANEEAGGANKKYVKYYTSKDVEGDTIKEPAVKKNKSNFIPGRKILVRKQILMKKMLKMKKMVKNMSKISKMKQMIQKISKMKKNQHMTLLWL